MRGVDISICSQVPHFFYLQRKNREIFKVLLDLRGKKSEKAEKHLLIATSILLNSP